MTKEQYLEQAKKFQEEYESNLTKLGFAFAKANRRFEVGDIIKNTSTTIKIESFGWTKDHMTKLPTPVYRGVVLTKKLTPTTKGDKYSICDGPDVELVRKA